jgi:anion-transporting  ArsA/GET3 family ATPase
MFNLVTASFGVFSRVVQKILGAQLLTDLSGFVAALDSMFGGFRQRAEHTYRVLQDRETAFLLVAAPEPDAVREAQYFAERLVAERMPLAGLVLNRVHRAALELDADASVAAADALDAAGDQAVTAGALRVHAALVRQTEREARVAAEFTDAFPAVPTVAVTAQPADIHDVDGLRTIGDALAA